MCEAAPPIPKGLQHDVCRSARLATPVNYLRLDRASNVLALRTAVERMRRSVLHVCCMDGVARAGMGGYVLDTEWYRRLRGVFRIWSTKNPAKPLSWRVLLWLRG